MFPCLAQSLLNTSANPKAGKKKKKKNAEKAAAGETALEVEGEA
jgi:hypothetical protein